MKRADPLFKLRLPDYMREKLEHEASQKRRSLTAEILDRLEQSFSDTNERLSALENLVFDTKYGNESIRDEFDELRRQNNLGIDYD
ncbi:Arc family DNA-binding protein [Commensalibacter papalotli (ex Servin-Garciduenas et al. 2014)]|uniref:Arc-like DNA binding domain-containing protein n=1 Tax=Commensalibacter papalotli (ex Servin-Garciduenas et al. 2014) TaxID=1208583 RepID=W7DNG8_9PROT|nr:Arc family DNA-binding protein [Commensalibacter papalotli (ex Servin-Garciduenas et al. 2014)]EUK18827.1 hypothetical protein COMX_03725 [Commensalibacter papalotli (ex Servin-Garciduenas et al. 2014)]